MFGFGKKQNENIKNGLKGLTPAHFTLLQMWSAELSGKSLNIFADGIKSAYEDLTEGVNIYHSDENPETGSLMAFLGLYYNQVIGKSDYDRDMTPNRILGVLQDSIGEESQYLADVYVNFKREVEHIGVDFMDAMNNNGYYAVTTLLLHMVKCLAMSDQWEDINKDHLRIIATHLNGALSQLSNQGLEVKGLEVNENPVYDIIITSAKGYVKKGEAIPANISKYLYDL